MNGVVSTIPFGKPLTMAEAKLLARTGIRVATEANTLVYILSVDELLDMVEVRADTWAYSQWFDADCLRVEEIEWVYCGEEQGHQERIK